jgi:hypothetical protein
LELNLATEILNLPRNQWGFPKAYLRGLTQREEKQEGVDFFAQLNPKARLFAFQFKAPRGMSQATTYRFSLNREQHDALFALAQVATESVFYVFPYYVTTAKLQADVPTLVTDIGTLAAGSDQYNRLSGIKGGQATFSRCDRRRLCDSPLPCQESRAGSRLDLFIM